MYIELSHDHGSYFQISYQEDKNRKGKWSSYVIEDLPGSRELTNVGLLRFVAQDQETYFKLKSFISVLFRREIGHLTYQTRLVESFSQLTFCDHLQPVAEQIRQESLAWFGDSSFQVVSAPDLLEGL